MYISYRGKFILAISEKPVQSNDTSIKFLKVPAELEKEDLKNYEVYKDTLVKIGSKKDPKQMKLAIVSVYKIRCGIATYGEAIYPELVKHFGDYKIFSEYGDTPEEPHVIRCWKRGQPLIDLVTQIEAYAPDVVLIQHEYGIFPIASHWLSFISAIQKYKTFVTMHSVYTHKDKTIVDAAIKNIIVHTNAAKDILTKVKNVPGTVSIIPHFCRPCTNPTRYYNMYHSEHTLMQFGFGFKYKGWEQALQIVAQLKDEFPDIFFTGLFSESEFSAAFHEQYHNDLYTEIKRLGIQQHVALIRGYQSDESLDAYLHVNRIAIFPYIENGEHTVYGCSGAARLAMTAGIPVIVTQVPLFDDLEGICPRADSIEEICKVIRNYFKDWKLRKKQTEIQNKFLIDNSIEITAQRYCDLLCS